MERHGTSFIDVFNCHNISRVAPSLIQATSLRFSPIKASRIDSMCRKCHKLLGTLTITIKESIGVQAYTPLQL